MLSTACAPLGSALRRRLDPVWAVVIVLSCLTVVLGCVALLAGRLVLESRPAIATALPPPAATPATTARSTLRRDAGQWRLRIEGPPGRRVLVDMDDQPLTVVTLDEHGSAEIGEPAAGPAPSLSVVLLPESEIPVERIAGTETAKTPTARATPTLAATAAASLTPTASSTATAVSTSTPTPTATASASPTAVPPATATPASTPSRAAVPPTPAVAAPPVLHLVIDAGPRIALTFDGGASSNGTTELLRLLRELHLKATLFLTGEFIEREPELLRQALLDGHEIGNHTFSHPHLTTYASNGRHQLLPGVSREFLHDQLRRTEEAFTRATGRRMAPLWRAPFGEENATLRGWAAELGYLHVRWSSLSGSSLDSWDWVNDEHSRLYEDPDKMIERLLAFPRLEGGIVLMHLASDRAVPPWKALPRLVTILRERAIEPVRVSDLLTASRTWRPQYLAASRRHRQVFPE